MVVKVLLIIKPFNKCYLRKSTSSYDNNEDFVSGKMSNCGGSSGGGELSCFKQENKLMGSTIYTDKNTSSSKKML